MNLIQVSNIVNKCKRFLFKFTSGTGKQWPNVYCLPLIPAMVKDHLSAAKSVIDLDRRYMVDLVHILHSDMCQSTQLVSL